MKAPKGDFQDIDKYRLDVEWVRQPKMTRYWGEELAHAKRDFRALKTKIKIKSAELAKRVRRKPGKYGLKSPTIAAVKDEVDIQMAQKGYLDQLNEAEHKVDILAVAVETLQTRKKGLEDLVYLHGIGYMAEPRRPKNMTREQEQRMVEGTIPGVKPRKKKDRK